MNELTLREEILDYEDLFPAFQILSKIRDKFYVTDDHLTTALHEMYATMGAYQILACIASANGFEVVSTRQQNENHSSACEPLPKHQTVQEAGQEFLAALAAALGALRRMGVLDLCPFT